MDELDKILESSKDKRGYTFWRLGLKETCDIIGYKPPNIILPIIRRVWPNVLAHSIIGAQPMTGPIGQIHTLRSRYGNKNKCSK